MTTPARTLLRANPADHSASVSLTSHWPCRWKIRMTRFPHPQSGTSWKCTVAEMFSTPDTSDTTMLRGFGSPGPVPPELPSTRCESVARSRIATGQEGGVHQVVAHLMYARGEVEARGGAHSLHPLFRREYAIASTRAEWKSVCMPRRDGRVNLGEPLGTHGRVEARFLGAGLPQPLLVGQELGERAGEGRRGLESFQSRAVRGRRS
jgi:hypothetical protein